MTCTVLREEIAIRLLALLVLATGVAPTTNAQTAPATEIARQPEADQSTAQLDVRFTLDTNSRFGSFTYVPAQWGELHLRLENRGDAPRNLLCTTYFDEQPALQFGRQVWLPPRSKLSLSHPVLMPKADQFKDNTAGVQSLVIEKSSGNEVLVKDDSGQLLHDRSLLVAPTVRHTGVVAGWGYADAVPQDVMDLVIASRVNQGLNNKVTVLGTQFLPADETSLKYLDHIVLAEDRLIEDFAALTAVRRWLHGGGRLWVMLDRADPLILERLLGDDFQGHVVDRVGLTSVRIDKAPTLAAPNGEPGETVDYDEPVEMSRIVVSGMKILNTVNGWPAAMTGSFGEGRLLITTLGARGWIKPRPPLDEVKPGVPLPAPQSDYVPSSPMEDLAAYVLSKREPDLLSPSALESLAQEHVSYKVPTWTLIASTMCGFLAALFAAAIWLWRMDCVEHFGWSGSLLAITFGLVLMGIGHSNRYRVPGTIASVQLAQAIGGTDDVRTQGVLAVYRPKGDQSLIQTAAGGELWSDMTALEGSTRRMVTTDLGTFHWEGLPQPAGLSMHRDAASGSIADRIEARATLDARGIVGRFSGHPATGADAMLATRYGRIGVQLAADGVFTARADDVFQSDQYLDANFLGDEQDRRRRMLQELFVNQTWQDSLDRPQLLLWVNDWEHGFQFGDGLTRQGDTLLAVPLEISRPSAGTEIVIPSPLLSIATRRPPDGSLAAGFWDDARKEWQERSSPSSTWLSVQIPRGLLPLEATKASLEIKVSGPMGRIEILGVKNGAPVSLQTVMNPVGSLFLKIEDPDVLTISDQGDLSLGINAGDPTEVAGASAANFWRIDSLALQVWAKASNRSEED